MSDTATMQDTAALIDRYIAMWNEPDPDARRELVARTMSDDAVYLDPLMSGNGTDGISAMIGVARKQFPEHRLGLVGAPDAHHDRVRFAWSLAPERGDPVAVGVDFAIIAQDGRLRSVTGFLESAG